MSTKPLGEVHSWGVGNLKWQRVGDTLRCTEKFVPAGLTAHGEWFREPVGPESRWAFGPYAWYVHIVEWVGHLALNSETVSPRNGK